MKTNRVTAMAAVRIGVGVLVPLVAATGHGLRHVGRNLRPLSRHVIRGSLVLGSVFTLVVATLMMAQQVAGEPPIIASAPRGDYALALGILWGVLVAVAALSVAGVELYPRRVNRQINRSRPASASSDPPKRSVAGKVVH